MRKSFLKKLGAAVTIVAMLASMCVVGFAADGTITIGNPVVTETSEGSGIYKVEIPYTSTANNVIGVTMLSYVSQNGTFTGTTSPADNPYNGSSMQIVGIDQVADGAKIEFCVTTKDDSSTSIRMDEGEWGIVLLGGDNVAAPVGVMFQIPKVAKAAAKVQYDGGLKSIDITGVAASSVVATIKSQLTDLVANLYATDDAEEAGDTIDITEAMISVKAEAGEGSNYKAVITIPAGTEGKDGNLKTGETATTLNVPINATWKANAAKLNNDENALSGTKKAVTDSPNNGDLDAAVLAAVKRYGVLLTDGTNEAEVTNTADAGVITVEKTAGEAFNSTATEAQEFTYKVTVSTAAAADGVVVESALEFNVAVTIEALEDNEFFVTSAKAFKADGTTEVKSIEVANGTSEADAKAAIAAAFASVTVYGEAEEDVETGWTATDWTIANYDGSAAATYKATATLVVPETRGERKGVNKSAKKLTINVKVADPISYTATASAVSVEVADTATVNDVKTAVEAEIKKLSATVKKDDAELGTAALSDVDVDTSSITAASAGSYSIPVTIPADTTVGGEAIPAVTFNVSVTVTVKAAGPDVLLGDINDDKAVDSLDLAALANHISQFKTIAEMSSSSSKEFVAADINGDKTVDSLDLAALANHISQFKLDNNIGKPVK